MAQDIQNNGSKEHLLLYEEQEDFTMFSVGIVNEFQYKEVRI